MKTILELADDYAKAYFMDRGEEARKLLQARVMQAETDAYLVEQQLDKLAVPSTSDQLREEYRSGLDSPDNTPEGEE